MDSPLPQMISDLRKSFEQIVQFAMCASADTQIHEAEETMLKKMMQMGKEVFKIFLETRGTGSVGAVHEDGKGKERDLHSYRERQYFSIFGKVSITRAYYWRLNAGGIYPLDSRMNSPENSQSYLLEKWMRDNKVNDIYEGTQQVQMLVIARRILEYGRDMLSRWAHRPRKIR